jgi:hypothetical protein
MSKIIARACASVLFSQGKETFAHGEKSAVLNDSAAIAGGKAPCILKFPMI